MRAADPTTGRYLPPRGRYVSFLYLTESLGWGLIFADAMMRAGRIVWVGPDRYLVS